MNYYIKRRKKRNFTDRLRGFSVVTWLIIFTSIISVISFILFSLSDNYINYLALKPDNILQGKYLWTLASHMFIHGGIAHLLINMFVLFSLGNLIEKIIGQKRFIWFYLASGLFAGILSVLLAGYFGTTELGAKVFGAPDIFMVGASGAIFAIAGLYVLLLPRVRFMILFLPFFSLPAYIMVPAVLFVTWGASVLAGWPIGNVAHFGGFLVGIFYGLYLRTKYKRKVQKLQGMFR
ncbi:MAG: rhomboid family intramembrane serine protease [Nanoarchaeota archaeon]|nr:rhomboid family intramembrane serine protease [Nanoarchaeota archaeon]